MNSWDLYDANLEKTDKIVTKEEDIPNGYYHLALEIWIINDNNEVLLVKKALDYNRRYPGCWSCIGGNLLSNEEVYASIKKLVDQKIGIKIEDEEIINVMPPVKKDPHKYAYITCFIRKNIDEKMIEFKDNGSINAKYIPFDELINMCNNGEVAYYLISRINNEVLKQIN